MSDEPTPPEDDGSGDVTIGSEGPAADPVEDRYRRGVGITLAVLVMLGAWIAVIATNAATNESRTTREATRLAAEAQTANVLDHGVAAGLEQVHAQSELLPSRDPFDISGSAAAEVGATLDPERAEERLDRAQAEVDGALGDPSKGATAASIEARRLSLEQSAVVEERITWNARASQYETVMTTLAVAIFLVGFTLVVGRKIRPPVAVPGMILAVFCLGWAIHIYLKPIPDVARAAIKNTAVGQVALLGGHADEAVKHFDAAIAADDTYAPGYEGRGTAILVAANPDLLRTMAITDDSPEVLADAATDLTHAMDLGSAEDPTTLALASLVAIVGDDWDLAATLLEESISRNELTPGLQLWRSAVAVAQGDEETATEWLERAVKQFSDLKGTDTARTVTAQYLTLLERVAEQVPEQADLADRFRSDGVDRITRAAAGRDLTPVPDLAATFSVRNVVFDDGFTSVALDTTGVPEGAVVTVAGYERPAPGAAWVQPAELFYVGPATNGDGLRLETPRACAPVEYRFDLYVEGVLAGSTTAAGATATC